MRSKIFIKRSAVNGTAEQERDSIAIFKYELGLKVKDTLTPFKGTIIARAEYLSGQIQYLVQPDGCMDNGSPIGLEWILEYRIKTEGES